MREREAEIVAALESADLTIEGRLVDASNATLRCALVTSSGTSMRCVYKPVAGERPLWDFPHGTLSGREVAFYALSRLLSWPLVPITVWRTDGPAGPGMCQEWIDTDGEASVIDLVPVPEQRDGWAIVLEGTDGAGNAVRLIHATLREVQQLALLDAIANNADRKGGHILVGTDGRLWGIDHGVTFNAEDKLRSVLWGWAGEPIPADLLTDVRALDDTLRSAAGASVTRWLDADEVEALHDRIARLVTSGVFPRPSADWPAIPWPVF